MRSSRLSWSASILARSCWDSSWATRASSRRWSPCAADDRGLVLGHGDAITRTEMLDTDFGQFDAGVLGDHVPTQRHREVFELGDPSVPETGGPDDHRLHRLVHVAADEKLQRRPVDVLGQHHQGPVGALGHLDARHDVLNLGDLLVGQQDQRIGMHRFHPLRVGDHVAGDVAVIELDAVDDVDRQPGGVALLGGDDARTCRRGRRRVEMASPDHLVVAGGEGAMRCRSLCSRRRDACSRRASTTTDTARSMPRRTRMGLAPASTDAQPLPDHGLGEHGCRGGAVADHAIGLHRHFLDQLGTHVGERVPELYLPGDGDAVVGDGGRSGEFLQDGVAPLGAERHLDRVGEGVDALFEPSPGVRVEPQFFGHDRKFLPYEQFW